MNRIMLLLSVGLLLGASTLWAADFNHEQHQSMAGDPACVTCHVAGAQEIIPDNKVCLECHDQAFVDSVKLPGLVTHDVTWSLNHRGAAVAKSIDCAACHEQDDCLDCHKAGRADEMGKLGNTMTNVHRSDFAVSHPIAARTNPQLCNKCHENKFCVSCHDDFKRAGIDTALDSHRKGFTNGTLDGAHAFFTEQQCEGCHPNSVLPSHQWSSSHAREARKNLATCQACHPDGDVCLKCHSARPGSGLRVNPHPSGWDDMKSRLKRASDAKTCRKCH